MIRKAIALSLVFTMTSCWGALPPLRSAGQDQALKPVLQMLFPEQQVTNLGGIKKLIETGNDNPLANPGFESLNAEDGWTLAGGGTPSEDTTDVKGKQSLSVSLTAQALDLSQTSTNTFYANKMFEASCSVKSSAAVDVCAYDGSDLQCVSSGGSDTWEKLKAFAGAGAAGIRGVRIKTASTTDVVEVDDCKVGEFSPDGTTRVLRQSFSDDSIPDADWNSAGVIEFVATIPNTGDTVLLQRTVGSLTLFTCQISSGCDVDAWIYGVLGGTSGYLRIRKYDTDDSTILLDAVGMDPQATAQQATTSTGFSLKFNQSIGFFESATIDLTAALKLEITATAYEQATVLAQPSGYLVDANIGGAGEISLSTTVDLAVYTEATDTGLDLVKNAGTAPVGIACAGTDTSVIDVLTCNAGAGNEGVGIIFNYSGKVEVCAAFAHGGSSDAAGSIEVTWQLVKTPHNAQTILQEGGERVESSPDANATVAAYTVNPIRVCGIFDANGDTTIRLMREQQLTATVAVNNIRANRDANRGQKDVHFSVKPVATNIVGTFKPAVNATKVTATSAQGPSTTFQPIVFDTAQYDPDGNFNLSTEKYTVPSDGFYDFSAVILFTTATTGYRQVEIRKTNGTDRTICINGMNGHSSTASPLSTSCSRYMLAGDEVEVFAYSSVSVSTVVSATHDYMTFSATKVDQAGVINEIAKDTFKHPNPAAAWGAGGKQTVIVSAEVAANGTVTEEDDDFLNGNCAANATNSTCTFTTDYWDGKFRCWYTSQPNGAVFPRAGVSGGNAWSTNWYDTADVPTGNVYPYTLACMGKKK